MIQRAVLFDLIVIGEAANSISRQLRATNSHITWRGAIDMRNFAAHGYFAINYTRIWETVFRVIPAFREQIATVLQAEFPESDES